MLERVTAVEYVRPMDAGRTSPLLLTCEAANGALIPVVTKFSSYCDEGAVNLAREVVAACLAADLGLPLPQPYIVDIPAGWPAVIEDAERRRRVEASLPVAFGSRLITGGYSVWTTSTRITGGMEAAAAAVFAFDAIIQNPDRRDGNPNCLVRGEEIRVIDHELAFSHGVILGWKPPWVVGALNWMETEGKHIFCPDLRRASGLDFAQVKEKWTAIDDARIAQYGAAVPAEWNASAKNVADALSLIQSARDNIDGCLTEIARVLS